MLFLQLKKKKKCKPQNSNFNLATWLLLSGNNETGGMALVRSVVSILSKWKQRRKEAPDIWKLYHYLHFYRQAVENPRVYGSQIGEAGRLIDFQQPAKNLSWRKHHMIVNDAVTEQVRRSGRSV